jgi:hypothetical protein
LFIACSITTEQLKGIALQSQQSKRANTQKSYGVQERKFKVRAMAFNRLSPRYAHASGY